MEFFEKDVGRNFEEIVCNEEDYEGDDELVLGYVCFGEEVIVMIMVEDMGIVNVVVIKGVEEVCLCCKWEDVNILFLYERFDGFGIFFLDL